MAYFGGAFAERVREFSHDHDDAHMRVEVVTLNGERLDALRLRADEKGTNISTRDDRLIFLPYDPYRGSRHAANARREERQQCNFSLSVPLTFTFPAGTTFTNGQEVVWTVQFDTTHAGYRAIGENTTCFRNNPPGCGYDSLKVGTRSYVNAPYAGVDVNEDIGAMATAATAVHSCLWARSRAGPATGRWARSSSDRRHPTNDTCSRSGPSRGRFANRD